MRWRGCLRSRGPRASSAPSVTQDQTAGRRIARPPGRARSPGRAQPNDVLAGPVLPPTVRSGLVAAEAAVRRECPLWRVLARKRTVRIRPNSAERTTAAKDRFGSECAMRREFSSIVRVHIHVGYGHGDGGFAYSPPIPQRKQITIAPPGNRRTDPIRALLARVLTDRFAEQNSPAVEGRLMIYRQTPLVLYGDMR